MPRTNEPKTEILMKISKKNQPSKNGLSIAERRGLEARLREEREQVSERIKRHEELARQRQDNLPDEFDVASEESHRSVTLRLLDKERKLLAELGHALAKFEDESYGLCEGNGEPIGFARLAARPWARYSLSYKEELETEERGYARG